MDSIQAAFERASAWFEANPAVYAFLLGWFFAILITQAIKRIWFPVTWPVTYTKRASQALAMTIASLVTYRLWPDGAKHHVDFSLLAGMSCPQVYTALKWALPNLMRRWGWSVIQETKIDAAMCEAKDDTHVQ